MSNYKIERGVAIPKQDLIPNPWNPNKTTKRQQTAIAQSLNLYGQVLEIVVRPSPTQSGKYEIIDGEHRYQELPDTVFANVIHGLPDADAKKLTIVLNETRGEADKIELAQLLAAIDKELGGGEKAISPVSSRIAALPYDDQEYLELIKLAECDWDNYGSSSNNNSADGNISFGSRSEENQERSRQDTKQDEEDDEDFEDPPVSGVRMMQLFLNTETQPEFMQMVEFLNPILETDNPTDCVMAVMRQVYAIARNNPYPDQQTQT